MKKIAAALVALLATATAAHAAAPEALHNLLTNKGDRRMSAMGKRTLSSDAPPAERLAD